MRTTEMSGGARADARPTAADRPTADERSTPGDAGLSGSDPLGPALADIVSRWLPDREIERVERKLAPYRSSRWLEYVTLYLDDGTIVPLVWKDAVRPVSGSNADRVKPPMVVDMGREAWVYCNVLGIGRGRETGGTGRAPKLWGVVGGEGSRPRGLVLERIEGVPLPEVGSPRAWAAAARWLSEFHAHPIPEDSAAAPLLRHDRELHEGWLDRAGRSGTLDVPGPGERQRLGAAHRRALDLAFDGPAALLHGEFYPSNVIAREGPAGWTVHPVDWEMSGPGPAILDLAALTSGAWDSGERQRIALAYHDAAPAATARGATDFLARLTAGRLLLAVQWLGWADDAWTPPVAHRTNWLETALECAEEIA